MKNGSFNFIITLLLFGLFAVDYYDANMFYKKAAPALSAWEEQPAWDSVRSEFYLVNKGQLDSFVVRATAASENLRTFLDTTPPVQTQEYSNTVLDYRTLITRIGMAREIVQMDSTGTK